VLKQYVFLKYLYNTILVQFPPFTLHPFHSLASKNKTMRNKQLLSFLLLFSYASYVSVIACPTPTIILGGVASSFAFCSGSDLNIQVIIPNLVDIYQWSDGTTGNFLSGANVITVNQGGIYTVTVTDGTGCSATATASVTEYLRPTAISNSSVSVGGNLNLMETGGNSTWLWSGPDNFTSTVQNPTISNATTNATGTYNVTVSNSTSVVPYKFADSMPKLT